MEAQPIKMDIVGGYGKILKRRAADRPGAALFMLRAGLLYESARVALRSGGGMPRALARLNLMALGSVRRALADPQGSVWVNLFAPVEILHCFGLAPLSIECFSSFMAGFRVEDYFIDRAERAGMPDTLCSYHKNFIGVVDSRVLPPPLLSLTTTLACDCNLNTFRHIEGSMGVKSHVIDVPYEYSPAAESYVTGQLEALVADLERATGRAFRPERLKEALDIENSCRELHESALRLQAERDYPCAPTLHMFKLFATHLLPGSREVLGYYRLLNEELEASPASEAVRILWIHLLPFYDESLKALLAPGSGFRIICSDFDLDYRERLDSSKPLAALARKMLLNVYNGPYERKMRMAAEAADLLRPDCVVHFCHWGCRQSAGGVMEMKRMFGERGLPMLILDGDGMDRRGSPDGQIRTRLEAFFETLGAARAAGRDPGPDPVTGENGVGGGR
ncbi:MAG: 2-hydroxyacyl-CoA dehydratase family protein [Clostridiales Family XIII bacterium]|jgi:benzoyl-CoA reductase/2-hydroxyglutaryl-CoA dehydratase subunit BcrC/BadD/HgdB|nr:2-hydroxyacyl-CoA dehydratase family protein [Clostridiales Family XIII bacterium]